MPFPWPGEVMRRQDTLRLGSCRLRGMEKLPSLHEAGSGFWNNFGTQAFVVRSSKRSDFEIDGLLSDLELQVPIDTPIYVGDIVEREDPRGGVLEYAVTDVKFERDPFGDGDDYSNVILRDKGHDDRRYGSTYNFSFNGGNNQVSTGDGASFTQNINEDAAELIKALKGLLAGAPRHALAGEQLEELDDAVEEATERAMSTSEKPSAVRRSVLAVKGVLEGIATSTQAGANDAVKVWARAGATTLLGFVTGGSS